MDPITIGLALSAAGAVTSLFGGNKAKHAQEEAIAAQQRAEAIRFKAMQIDADRRRREMIRQGIIARSQALAVGTSQGMSTGSAQQGAFGQISGFTGWGIQGVNQQEQLGSELFQANKDLLSARRNEAQAGTISSFGAGLSSLGGAVLGNAATINRLSGGLTNPMQPFNITSGYNNLGGSGPSYGAMTRGVRGLY